MAAASAGLWPDILGKKKDFPSDEYVLAHIEV